VNEFRAIHALCYASADAGVDLNPVDGIVSIDLKIVRPGNSRCQGLSVSRIAHNRLSDIRDPDGHACSVKRRDFSRAANGLE